MIQNKKGFTLIELIVSFALLVLLAVAFLSMFSSGMTSISKAGSKSAKNYTAQQNIERIISNPSNATGSMQSSPATITIEFPSGGGTYTVTGRKIDVQTSTHIMTTFTTN